MKISSRTTAYLCFFCSPSHANDKLFHDVIILRIATDRTNGRFIA